MSKLQASFANKSKSIDLIYVAIITVFGLVLVLPAVLYGAFDAMDIPFHLRWTKLFVEQFWNGDLYPRWLQNMNAGLGSPAFFFYAPIPYYFTSLFHPFFSPETRQWGQLSAAIALALIASGITAYVWLSTIVDRRTALIGSLLYIILPYHLGVNLYWRFAFAEYWALVWLPLILYFCYQLVQRSRFAVVGLAISYALLIMTHLPTLIIFAPVSILYLLTIGAGNRLKLAIRAAIALSFSVALSAIYWLPAMTTQDAISMNAILENAYFYGNNFLFSRKFLPHHSLKFWVFLEVTSLLMIAIASCAFVLNRSLPIQRENRFWFGVSVVSFLMMTPIALPIWAIFTPLQRIQFPWRFNAVLLVSTTALLTLALYSFPILLRKRQKAIFAVGITLATVLILFNAVAMKGRLKPIKSPAAVQAIAINKETALEYRPKWVAPAQFETPAIAAISQQLANGWQLDQAGTIAIQSWKPRQITLRSSVLTDTWLTLRQFYYPGWTATASNRQLSVEPSASEGLLRVKLPSGAQTVTVTLEAGLMERIGQWTSAIAGLLLLGLSLMRKRTPVQSVPEATRLPVR